MTLVAIVRSALHIQFLVANGASPDVVLFRESWLANEVDRAFPQRGMLLGRETRPARSLRGLYSAHKSNRGYYRDVARRFARIGECDLIIFLEGEPLERFVCQLPQVRAVELWEDGLSHYVDLTHDLWYGARGVVQAACGFYPTGITKRRMDRSHVLVRDRFEQKNLLLPLPPSGASVRNEFVLIGSPIVEDRLVTADRFCQAIATVARASPWPVRYLAHPREDQMRARQAVAGSGLVFDANEDGLLSHAGRFAYRAYGAAVSTGLLDLGRYPRSVFVPGLFGLARMARILSRWPANPVRVIDREVEMHAFLHALDRDVPRNGAPDGMPSTFGAEREALD